MVRTRTDHSQHGRFREQNQIFAPAAGLAHAWLFVVAGPSRNRRRRPPPQRPPPACWPLVRRLWWCCVAPASRQSRQAVTTLHTRSASRESATLGARLPGRSRICSHVDASTTDICSSSAQVLPIYCIERCCSRSTLRSSQLPDPGESTCLQGYLRDRQATSTPTAHPCTVPSTYLPTYLQSLVCSPLLPCSDHHRITGSRKARHRW